MCPARLGAHDGCMFTNYDMTKAFVAERQETLRHEARQHRLGRSHRRRQRRPVARRVAPIATPVELPSRPTSGATDRMAA
jgi:hypothetical protein